MPRFDKNVGMESAPDNTASLKGDKDSSYNEVVTEAVAELEPEVSFFGFDLLLSSQEGYLGYDNFSEIPRDRGKTYILWRHVDGGKLCMSRALEESEIEAMSESLGVGESVGDKSPTLEFNVWILRGDGSIISPYLIGSEGNIGNALFDYEAEIIPQETLIELVERILANKPQN